MKTDCIRFLRHWNLMLSTNHRTKLFLYHLLTFKLEVLYTDVNIKIKNMNTSIKNILTSWESSLIRFQKIDRWNYSENLATLGWYLHNNDCTIEEYYLIKYIRDSIIGVSFNVKSVLKAIQKLMNMEAGKNGRKQSCPQWSGCTLQERDRENLQGEAQVQERNDAP